MTIEFESAKLDGKLYLWVRGILNARYAPDLETHIKALAPAASNTRIVLHLGSVPFIDSAGISAIINAVKIVQQHGGTLTLAAVPTEILDVFKKTLLTEFLQFEPPPDDPPDAQPGTP